jgi:hydrogenase expression/formation protein HypE
MDIVMVGSIGVGATLALASKYENVLRKKFSSSFVDDVFALEKVADTDRYLEMIQDAALVYKVGSEGTFAGLYETSKFMNKGIEVEIPDIPVWQEVVEVAEVFDVNPYKADGTGALIIVCNSGADMVKCFLDEGILASVIGKVTDNNDKVARNGDEVRYLEPTRVEELANLL